MIIEIDGDVLKLRGVLEDNQWQPIKSAVMLMLKEHPGGVIIDCSGLTDVTEQGAKTFVDASNFIQSHNARIVISGISDDILAEIKKLPGVRSQLVVANSIDEARASLQCVGETVCPPSEGPVVLVPLMGAWRDILDFAAVHALARKAEIHVLYIMQIPRNLPIGVPMPEIENEAANALHEAEKLLKKRNVKVVRLTTRARDLMEGATRYAIENNPSLIVVGYTKSELIRDGGRCPVINMLCHDAPCDVAVYCIAE